MVYGEPPLAWFWGNMGHATLGWTAICYMMYFWIYMIVTVVEFAAWCLYISGGDGWLYGFWGQFAKYATFIGYIIPPIFAAMQLWLPVT